MHELQNDNMAWNFCLNDKQYLRIDGLYYAINIITKILFRTLSNIYDGAIYGNSNVFQPFTIFTISSILDIDPRLNTSLKTTTIVLSFIPKLSSHFQLCLIFINISFPFE